MHYEINVALNGKHFFGTAPRSLSTLEDTAHLYSVFLDKFPSNEGYEISVTCHRQTAQRIAIGA